VDLAQVATTRVAPILPFVEEPAAVADADETGLHQGKMYRTGEIG